MTKHNQPKEDKLSSIVIPLMEKFGLAWNVVKLSNSKKTNVSP